MLRDVLVEDSQVEVECMNVKGHLITSTWMGSKDFYTIDMKCEGIFWYSGHEYKGDFDNVDKNCEVVNRFILIKKSFSFYFTLY